jgi:hypothetical protein
LSPTLECPSYRGSSNLHAIEAWNDEEHYATRAGIN